MAKVFATLSTRIMALGTNSNNNPIIGRGLSFPLGIGQQGGFVLTNGDSELTQAINLILSTSPGERVMRPTFGSQLKELVYEPATPTTAALAVRYVEEALAMWEPRIVVNDVFAEPDPEFGRIMLDISYDVKATNDRRSLVFPFYTIPENE